MRTYFLLITFSFFQVNLSSQSIEIFYDDEFKICLKEFASFKRTWDSDQFFNTQFVDIDMNGFKIRSGGYVDSSKVGEFEIYYSRSNQIFSKGKYLNNEMVDIWDFFYKNGQLRYKVEFKNGDFTVLESYDSTGINLISNGTGLFMHDYINSNNVNSSITGEYKNKNKHGKWEFKVDNRLFVKEIYDSGIFKKGNRYDLNPQGSRIKKPLITGVFFESTALGLIEKNRYSKLLYQEDYPFLSFLQSKPDSTVFGLVRANAVGMIDNKIITQIQQPKYPGGEKEFKELYRLNVLKVAVETYIDKGQFYLSFEIDTMGIPRNFVIMHAPNESFEIATLNSMKNIKRWIPGYYEGNAIQTKMNYTIKFSLVVQ